MSALQTDEATWLFEDAAAEIQRERHQTRAVATRKRTSSTNGYGARVREQAEAPSANTEPVMTGAGEVQNAERAAFRGGWRTTIVAAPLIATGMLILHRDLRFALVAGAVVGAIAGALALLLCFVYTQPDRPDSPDPQQP